MKYHRNAYGLPKFQPFAMFLTYSEHAKKRAAEKGISNLPQTIISRDCTVFEIEDTDIRKYALRTKYNATHALCMAVDEKGFVRTVWLNRHDDRHCTLNKKLYDRP